MVKKVPLNYVVLLADGVEARKAGREINVYSSQGKSFTTPQSEEPSAINSLLAGLADFPNGYGNFSKSE